MCGNGGINQLAPMGLQLPERADFVGAHEPAVADDICSEDCRKPALDGIALHNCSQQSPRRTGVSCWFGSNENQQNKLKP
jgi:hypothetical protein